MARRSLRDRNASAIAADPIAAPKTTAVDDQPNTMNAHSTSIEVFSILAIIFGMLGIAVGLKALRGS